MNPTPNPSSLWEMQWSNGWQGDLQFDGFGSKTLTGHCAVLLSGVYQMGTGKLENIVPTKYKKDCKSLK